MFVWQHLNRQKCGFYVTKKNTEKQWDKSNWFVAVKEMALFGITSVNGILSQTSSSDLFWQCWECGFLIWQTSTDSSNILPVPSYPVPSYPVWTSGLDTSPTAPESLPAHDKHLIYHSIPHLKAIWTRNMEKKHMGWNGVPHFPNYQGLSKNGLYPPHVFFGRGNMGDTPWALGIPKSCKVMPPVVDQPI